MTCWLDYIVYNQWEWVGITNDIYLAAMTLSNFSLFFLFTVLTFLFSNPNRKCNSINCSHHVVVSKNHNNNLAQKLEWFLGQKSAESILHLLGNRRLHFSAAAARAKSLWKGTQHTSSTKDCRGGNIYRQAGVVSG